MSRRKETYSFVNEWKSMWEPDLEAIAYNGTTCDPTRVDPKVLEWAKRHCSHKPHFIKIVNSNAANGRPGLKPHGNNCQLTVPRPFVKEHFRELERVVTLENEEGKTWRVSFGAARTDPSWLQGWKRVAADNDLKPGEVIVFVLVANSRFHFTRFDEDGNLITKESTNSTAAKKRSTTLSATLSREKPSSFTNPDDEPQLRSSWTSKRAAAVASGLGFDGDGHGHGHEAPHLLAEVQTSRYVTEAPFKRRRLRKVGETMSKPYSNNEHPLYDSEEAGSTSMADSPSTITMVASHPPH